MRTPWRTRVGPAPIGPPIGRRPHAARYARASAVREAVVRTRAAWITRLQSLVRREGCRLRPGAPETFVTRLEELPLPPALMPVIAPLVELLGPINQQIEALDEELEHRTWDLARLLGITVDEQLIVP
jgi:transposase